MQPPGSCDSAAAQGSVYMPETPAGAPLRLLLGPDSSLDHLPFLALPSLQSSLFSVCNRFLIRYAGEFCLFFLYPYVIHISKGLLSPRFPFLVIITSCLPDRFYLAVVIWGFVLGPACLLSRGEARGGASHVALD